MKFAGKILVLAVMLCSLLMYSGCKPKPSEPEPITDTQLALLTAGVWRVTAVTRDNINQISDYGNFKLTMTGTKGNKTFNYSTAGRPSLSPWDAAGTFTFDTATPATLLSRGDTPIPLSVTYSVVSGSSSTLTMSFNYSGSGFSRVGVVNGQWSFTMVTP